MERMRNPKEKVTMFNEIPTATLQRYNATEGCPHDYSGELASDVLSECNDDANESRAKLV